MPNMIAPVKVAPISELVDFKGGPFSDNKIYSHSQRRIICEQLLRQMLKYPGKNASDIILVNETLKGLG